MSFGKNFVKTVILIIIGFFIGTAINSAMAAPKDTNARRYQDVTCNQYSTRDNQSWYVQGFWAGTISDPTLTPNVVVQRSEGAPQDLAFRFVCGREDVRQFIIDKGAGAVEATVTYYEAGVTLGRVTVPVTIYGSGATTDSPPVRSNLMCWPSVGELGPDRWHASVFWDRDAALPEVALYGNPNGTIDETLDLPCAADDGNNDRRVRVFREQGSNVGVVTVEENGVHVVEPYQIPIIQPIP